MTITASQSACKECDHVLASRCASHFLPDLKTSYNEVRNNNILSYIDFSSLLDEITRIDGHIAHIDETMAQVMARLRKHKEELCKQKEEIYTIQSNKGSLLSPIRRVPDHVLQEIFLFCKMSYLEESEYQRHHEGYFAISGRRVEPNLVQRITQVCYYWRKLALAFPHLWSHILFSLEKAAPVNVTMMEKTIERCLQLSNSTALRIHFSEYYRDTHFNDICLKTLAQSCFRWEDAKLTLELIHDLGKYLLASSDRSFENLKSLRIVAHGRRAERLLEIPVKGLLPALTHLQMDSIVDPGCYFVGFPWAQITHFTSKRSDFFLPGGLCQLLENMANLESLSFQGKSYIVDRRAILPQLKRLTIRANYSLGVLAYLQTPQLQMLDIQGVAYNGADLPSLVVPFLQLSECALEELRMSETELRKEWECEITKHVKRLYVKLPGTMTLRPNEHRGIPAAVAFIEYIPFVFKRLESIHLIPPSRRGYPEDFTTQIIGSLHLALPLILSSDENRSLKTITVELGYGTGIYETLWREFVGSDTVRNSGVTVSLLFSTMP